MKIPIKMQYMKHETFTLSYAPVHAGTKQTAIDYFNTIAEIKTELAENIKNTLFVTDETVNKLPQMADFFNSIPSERVIVLPSGEKYKTIEQVIKILTQAVELGLNRSSSIIGIGGGVVTDMTAFAASLFKRGCRLMLVPTTLLAMADASIGGKTGCDFSGYKNTIGTFYPASRLLFSPEFLLTLSDREYYSGMAEVAKTAMLYAPKLFNILRDEKLLIQKRDQEVLMQIIKRCAQSKAMIVEKDLTETGIRKQLNLGHTFAHALEAIAGLGSLTHGEAVAWGLGRAIDLSNKLGYCDEDYKKDVYALLKDYNWSITPLHPVCIEQKIMDAPLKIIEAMKQDKKNNENGITLILQREINLTVIEIINEKDILSVLS